MNHQLSHFPTEIRLGFPHFPRSWDAFFEGEMSTPRKEIIELAIKPIQEPHSGRPWWPWLTRRDDVNSLGEFWKMIIKFIMLKLFIIWCKCAWWPNRIGFWTNFRIDIWELFMIFFVWYIGASLRNLGEATIPQIAKVVWTKPEDVGYNPLFWDLVIHQFTNSTW